MISDAPRAGFERDSASLLSARRSGKPHDLSLVAMRRACHRREQQRARAIGGEHGSGRRARNKRRFMLLSLSTNACYVVTHHARLYRGGSVIRGRDPRTPQRLEAIRHAFAWWIVFRSPFRKARFFRCSPLRLRPRRRRCAIADSNRRPRRSVVERTAHRSFASVTSARQHRVQSYALFRI